MYKAFSQILADGRKVTSLNVLAINKKLINKEVDAASSPLQERITPLMSPLSKERAQSGPLGQLKDGTHIASLSEDELKTELAKRNGTGFSTLALEQNERVLCPRPLVEVRILGISALAPWVK